MDLASLPLPAPPEDPLFCPLCRNPRTEAEEGRAGCPLCYDVFGATMRALLGTTAVTAPQPAQGTAQNSTQDS